MAGPRIFVSYAQESSQDSQFAHQLIEDLREAELEPVTLEDQSHDFAEENFVQMLNEKLLDCQWVLLVQTPEALTSPHVQLTINTALNLALQKRIRGVLAITTEPIPTQEIPPTWTTLKTFDASKDYSRALARLLLALQPSLSANMPTALVHVAPPPAFQATINAPALNGSPQPGGTTNDRPLPLIQSSWFMRKKMQQWLTPLAIGLIIIVVVAVSMSALARGTTARTRVATVAQIKTPSPIPTATPNAAATATTVAAATITANATTTAISAVNATATTSAINISAKETATAANLAHATAIAVKAVNAKATAIAMDPMTIFNNAVHQQPVLNDPLSSEDANGWDKISISTGSTITAFCDFNAAYVIYAQSPNPNQGNLNQKTICLARNIQLSNFAFQAQMKFVSTSSACGLVFRAKDANLSSYRFYISNKGTYDFYGYPDANGVVNPNTSQIPTSAIVTNQANTITAIAVNSVLYLYINGIFVTSTHTSANGAASGMIGMACKLDDQQMTVSEASFQSARVWQL